MNVYQKTPLRKRVAMPETGKISSKNISDKGLVSIVYKELLEFNRNKATNF